MPGDSINFTFERIVIVDDTAITRFLTRAVLELHNLAKSLIEFDSAVSALHYLENTESSTAMPELILLDINMPIMSGLEFLEQFSFLSEERKLNTMIVVLSSSLDQNECATAISHPHVRLFIRKPLTSDTMNLLAALKYV